MPLLSTVPSMQGENIFCHYMLFPELIIVATFSLPACSTMRDPRPKSYRSLLEAGK